MHFLPPAWDFLLFSWCEKEPLQSLSPWHRLTQRESGTEKCAKRRGLGNVLLKKNVTAHLHITSFSACQESSSEMYLLICVKENSSCDSGAVKLRVSQLVLEVRKCFRFGTQVGATAVLVTLWHHNAQWNVEFHYSQSCEGLDTPVTTEWPSVASAGLPGLVLACQHVRQCLWSE